MCIYLLRFLFGFILFFQVAGAQIKINGVVAVVNGNIITQSELEVVMLPQVRQLLKDYPNQGTKFQEAFKELQKNTLDTLIEEQLILDEFDSLGGQIPLIALKNSVNDEIQNLYNSDESKFYEKLKQSNLTLESYEQIIHDRIAVQALKSQQLNKVPPITPDELAAEYNLVKAELRDRGNDAAQCDKIYIPKPNKYNPNLLLQTQINKVEEVVAKFKNNEDFSEIAKRYSEDIYADKGGKWPVMKRKELANEFAEFVFEQPLNEVIGPLEDNSGYTFVRINERVLAEPVSLQEASPQLERKISIDKRNMFLMEWIEQLRKKAEITIKL